MDAIVDVLAKETFYKELPALSAATAQVQGAYRSRYEEAAGERRKTYEAALQKLAETSGWKELDAETRAAITDPLRRRAEEGDQTVPLAMLRETTLACPGILQNAVHRVIRSAAQGTEPEVLFLSELVRGPITSEEQLDAVLAEFRDLCLKCFADGTPVILA